MINRTTTTVLMLLLAFAALANVEPVGAQATGTVTGTVADAGSGQLLDGVRVHLPDLGLQALSRDGGRFVIPNVPAGTHELRAELIGREDLVRTVTVGDGATVSVELLMEHSVLYLEGLVVTGTAFSESPVELPYAVSVMGRGTLAEQGAPQSFDLFRNVTASAGILGARQGWYTTRPPGLVTETAASVNLRGIGASRTLVLVNGKRQVQFPMRISGGRFVDVNAFPSIATERVEIVKEGASAIYGSDAVAGVVNFLTRSDFEGLEFSGAHEYFAGAGETNVGLIWGSRVGESAHAVVSAEVFATQELLPEERDWMLQDFEPGGGGWSYTGNPGAFLFPQLTGDESREEFIGALTDAHYGGWGGIFIDPQCLDFGGFRQDDTCRFRYAPFDNLSEDSRQIRTFAELNGEFGGRSRYHIEGLWAEATVPSWITTPSYPPISPYNGTQIIQPDHPGRSAFCQGYGQSAGFATREECLQDDWYFFGRMVGNSGPPRTLRRDLRTQRIAASLERDLQLFGEREAAFEVAASFSRSAGNANLPGEYLYRKFLAFRGFGGPNCGVGVVVDPSTPSGMALGPLGGAVAGQGGCLYYNPFSNAHQYSAQPGARYRDSPNPDYVAGLDNTPELIDWINDEVNLDNEANLVTLDAMLRGALAEEGPTTRSGISSAGSPFPRFRTRPPTWPSIRVPCPVTGAASRRWGRSTSPPASTTTTTPRRSIASSPKPSWHSGTGSTARWRRTTSSTAPSAASTRKSPSGLNWRKHWPCAPRSRPPSGPLPWTT